jgi:hypothetical protein
MVPDLPKEVPSTLSRVKWAKKYLCPLELPTRKAVPIPRSKAWSCGRSLAGITDSNPAGDMDVCCVLCSKDKRNKPGQNNKEVSTAKVQREKKREEIKKENRQPLTQHRNAKSEETVSSVSRCENLKTRTIL